MTTTTLCFCLDRQKVLLGKKKRGFGAGLWNGYGGKVHENENIEHAAVRELLEESRLIADPEHLQLRATIGFYFEGVPAFKCYVYVTRIWEGGEPIETDEMKHQWFDLTNIPTDKMMPADPIWLPQVLVRGQRLDGFFNYTSDGHAILNSRLAIAA